jgi:transposase-like protein
MSKKKRIRDKFIEELAKSPIVQIACEKLGISRQTYYRWRREDIEFSKLADEALGQGEDLVNDVAESTVIRGVQNRDTSWTKYWLNRRHPNFTEHKYRSLPKDSKDEEIDTEEISTFIKGWEPALKKAQEEKIRQEIDKGVESKLNELRASGNLPEILTE